MIDSNLRDTPALIYISCREPEGPKAERGPKPRFNLGSGLPSWPLRRLFDLCSGRITHGIFFYNDGAFLFASIFADKELFEFNSLDDL